MCKNKILFIFFFFIFTFQLVAEKKLTAYYSYISKENEILGVELDQLVEMNDWNYLIWMDEPLWLIIPGNNIYLKIINVDIKNQEDFYQIIDNEPFLFNTDFKKRSLNNPEDTFNYDNYKDKYYYDSYQRLYYYDIDKYEYEHFYSRNSRNNNSSKEFITNAHIIYDLPKREIELSDREFKQALLDYHKRVKEKRLDQFFFINKHRIYIIRRLIDDKINDPINDYFLNRQSIDNSEVLYYCNKNKEIRCETTNSSSKIVNLNDFKHKECSPDEIIRNDYIY